MGDDMWKQGELMNPWEQRSAFPVQHPESLATPNLHPQGRSPMMEKRTSERKKKAKK